MKDAGNRLSGQQVISGVQIWLKMLKAFHAIGACLAPSLRATGLGDSDFRVLEALLHKGPLPVNTLGPKVFLTPGSISVAVDRLLLQKLVTRVDSETDRRVRVVALTTKGRSLIGKVFEQHAAELERVAGVLSKAERETLARALKKMGRHAEELTSK